MSTVPEVILCDVTTGASRYVALADLAARPTPILVAGTDRLDLLLKSSAIVAAGMVDLHGIGELALDYNHAQDAASRGQDQAARLAPMRNPPPKPRVKAMAVRIAGLDIRRFLPRRTG